MDTMGNNGTVWTIGTLCATIPYSVSGGRTTRRTITDIHHSTPFPRMERTTDIGPDVVVTVVTVVVLLGIQ